MFRATLFLMRARRKEIYKRIKTLEDFISRANIVHSKRYSYSQANYIDSKTPIAIICSEHGVFWQRPNLHLNGRGCPKCAYLKKGCSQRLSKDVFIEKAIKVHGYKYDYSFITYKNARTKINIVCPEHGLFAQAPGSHLSGNGCPVCGNIKIGDSKRLAVTEFIKRANAIHNGKYDYTLIDYKNVTSKIKIICPVHGVFSQIASIHLLGGGCRDCGYDQVSIKNRISKIDMIERFKNVHGDKYDYSKVDYNVVKDKIKIICPVHGAFYQVAFDHASGNGCPKCQESQGERKISLFLTEHKILFIPEYRFPDCVDKKPLPFDFYLPDFNTVIEYQGLQHYEPFKRWGGQAMLDYVKRHDTIKREFCNKNGIRLEEIKYLDNIEDKLKSIFNQPI